MVFATCAAPLHPSVADSAIRVAAGRAVVHLLTHCGRGVGHAASRRGAQRARHADGQEQKKGMFTFVACTIQTNATQQAFILLFTYIVPLRSIFAGALSTFRSAHFSAQFCIHSPNRL